jgi:hypothetical protein
MLARAPRSITSSGTPALSETCSWRNAKSAGISQGARARASAWRSHAAPAARASDAGARGHPQRRERHRCCRSTCIAEAVKLHTGRRPPAPLPRVACQLQSPRAVVALFDTGLQDLFPSCFVHTLLTLIYCFPVCFRRVLRAAAWILVCCGERGVL